MNASPLTDSRKWFQKTAVTFQGSVIEGISTVQFLMDDTLAEILSLRNKSRSDKNIFKLLQQHDFIVNYWKRLKHPSQWVETVPS